MSERSTWNITPVSAPRYRTVGLARGSGIWSLNNSTIDETKNEIPGK
jgi:hypothetical protein